MTPHIEHVTSEEMRKLCEAATPGPWAHRKAKVTGGDYEVQSETYPNYYIAETIGELEEGQEEANAQFIAAARTFIPWALSELEQAAQREASQKRRIEELELALCGKMVGENQKTGQYDLNKCPKCEGPADNGHDRCVPPNPYYCTKCELEPDDD